MHGATMKITNFIFWLVSDITSIIEDASSESKGLYFPSLWKIVMPSPSGWKFNNSEKKIFLLGLVDTEENGVNDSAKRLILQAPHDVTSHKTCVFS